MCLCKVANTFYIDLTFIRILIHVKENKTNLNGLTRIIIWHEYVIHCRLSFRMWSSRDVKLFDVVKVCCTPPRTWFRGVWCYFPWTLWYHHIHRIRGGRRVSFYKVLSINLKSYIELSSCLITLNFLFRHLPSLFFKPSGLNSFVLSLFM